MNQREVLPSGAPSQTTKSASSLLKCSIIFSAVLTLVISPWIWMTPSSGAMACRSTATIFGGLNDFSSFSFFSFSAFQCSLFGHENLIIIANDLLNIVDSLRSYIVSHLRRLDNTWLQLPGAAQRSTAFVTPEK